MARARARHAPCPRRRTSCRWRCWRPCSAAAPPRRSRCCWCWPCRSRCGVPGGSCGWPAGWPPRPGANRWLILWGATTYAAGAGRLAAPGARAARARSCPPRCCPGWRTPRSGSPTRRRTGAGERPGAPGCCWPWSAAARPLAWLVAALVGVVVVAARLHAAARRRAGPLGLGPARRRPAPWCPVLLAPWWLPALLHGAGEGLLLDGGLLPAPTPDGVELGLGRFHDLGAPWWLGVVLPVLAVLALVPAADPDPGAHLLGRRPARGARGRRRSVSITLDLAALSTPPGLGFLLVVVQAALVTAVVLGALGVAPPRGRTAGRWRCLLAAGRRGGAAGRAGLVRGRRRRPPHRRPRRRHPGLHGAELGARPRARDPRGPRLPGATG